MQGIKYLLSYIYIFLKFSYLSGKSFKFNKVFNKSINILPEFILSKSS